MKFCIVNSRFRASRRNRPRSALRYGWWISAERVERVAANLGLKSTQQLTFLH